MLDPRLCSQPPPPLCIPIFKQGTHVSVIVRQYQSRPAGRLGRLKHPSLPPPLPTPPTLPTPSQQPVPLPERYTQMINRRHLTDHSLTGLHLATKLHFSPFVERCAPCQVPRVLLVFGSSQAPLRLAPSLRYLAQHGTFSSGAHVAQCTRSAIIRAFGHTRNTYLVDSRGRHFVVSSSLRIWHIWKFTEFHPFSLSSPVFRTPYLARVRGWACLRPWWTLCDGCQPVSQHHPPREWEGGAWVPGLCHCVVSGPRPCPGHTGPRVCDGSLGQRRGAVQMGCGDGGKGSAGV